MSIQRRSRKFIGVFDSGFGGLDILRGIVKALPEYDYVYLGDSARNPYGNRSSEVVHAFTLQAVDFLFENNCELVILACNTASSDALRKIQKEYLPKHHPGKKVLGVLIPGAQQAMEQTKNKRIGIIATEGTVASQSFPHELKKLDPKVRVFQHACPLLVPLIESGEKDRKLIDTIITHSIAPLLKKNIDTLILGCTHYGHLEKQIRKIAGPDIHIISEAKAVPKKLREYLARHPELESVLSKKSRRTFYSTDLTGKFKTLGSTFFGTPINPRQATLH